MFLKKYQYILLAFILAASCISCSTLVHINTSTPGAEVVLDGKSIGSTPVSVRVKNIAWREYNVFIIKSGYNPMDTELTKEVKPLPAILGYIFIFPLIWSYGPVKNQYFYLYESKNAD